MENKTVYDIIQSTENAPSILNKLSEDFLAIESNFNATVDTLNSEKETIDKDSTDRITSLRKLYEKKLSDIATNTKNTLTSLQNQHEKDVSDINSKVANDLNLIQNKSKQKIADAQDILDNRRYVKKILESHAKSWISNNETFGFSRWIVLVLGVLFAFLIHPWYIGIVIGIVGYLILTSIWSDSGKKIKKLDEFYHGDFKRMGTQDSYSLQEITSLGTISLKLQEALNNEHNRIKIEIEILQRELNDEYNQTESKMTEERTLILNKINSEYESRKSKVIEERDQKINTINNEFQINEPREISDANQKRSEFETKKEKLMNELRQQTKNSIDNTNQVLNNLIPLLNQLPETFNVNSLGWNSKGIFKGKDQVDSNIRIGSQHFGISVEGTKYTIDVPLCLPFFNKTNLISKCKDKSQTEEAISISNNIIARALLALPPNKLKITFIDPLGLGSNAAPFTPLSREITGGMVFTQQNDIETQLSMLIRAIENIIQQYLQDKYADIADYNLKTKEVPEPYRLLVVYNFPHNFSDTTTKKLLNILKSGPRAGVHTILLIDSNTKLPYGTDSEIFYFNNCKELFDSYSIHTFENWFGNIFKGKFVTGVSYDIVYDLSKGYTDKVLAIISEITGRSISELKKEADDIISLLKYSALDTEGRFPYYHTRGLPIILRCNIFKELNRIKILLKEGITLKLTTDYFSQYAVDNDIIISPDLLNDIPDTFLDYDKELPYREVVDYINKELPNVSSVKVSFSKSVESQEKWWQEKTHKRFAVPIGRYALETQNLKFDNEDDNQALLIGKPGSGKSNLLHVIITNALWKYSPEQLAIYLIDFKGGVEFNIYAGKNIPHIRALAIESEREFGESILKKIYNLLLERERIIENTGGGVDSIYSYNEKCYRDNTPEKIMPRVLLIVDEFHVFFSEEDALADNVHSMFATIVQKGRAFGINTLLSSQTLSMRSIKPATKGLIDIRISLMCSENDATQIFDERNPAAKDLTRPGEGIYNDMGGKVEGNKRFQVFFIEKDELNKTIESVASFAKARLNGNNKFEQIIFRGSDKAILAKDNHPLQKVTSVSAPKSLRLWVGEPVAIAEEVKAIIRKQGGSNLLVAGYDENIGLRVMCSSIVSIAAQQQSRTCKFYSFNFYNVDSEFVNVPDELFNNIDQDCTSVSNRQVKEILEAIKQEIENRLSGQSTAGSNIYLTFFSFQRGRAFRKEGYSMSEEGNLLGYILKEGPDVGIFTLLQVDTMDNFSKNMDDNLLKEFSQRIASQMNPDNSVKVIGNQKAAKLGNNRAFYYDDNENILLKFKPYELPPFSWVAQLQKTQSTLS